MYILLYSIILLTISHDNTLVSASIQKPPHDGRIYGGEKTVIELHPHQVSLQRKGRHICGGTIISPTYIITAGHCVDFPLPSLTIRAGSSFRISGGSVHKIAKIVRHAKFRKNARDNSFYDVATIRVQEPFDFDDTRQPIQLFNVSEQIEAGTVAVVTGWGKMENRRPSLQLRVVSVPIVSKERCNNAYKKIQGGIGEGQICAGYYGVEDKDACDGDSGGPLVIGGRLAGIVSYGEDCADPYYPGVYSEIAYFRNWIEENSEL